MRQPEIHWLVSQGAVKSLCDLGEHIIITMLLFVKNTEIQKYCYWFNKHLVSNRQKYEWKPLWRFKMARHRLDAKLYLVY